VVAQRVPGDEQQPGDIRRRQAAQQELRDLPLPVGQPVQVEDERAMSCGVS
jgi:hypothetical protein